MAKKGPNNKTVDKGILGKNERIQMNILGNIRATKMWKNVFVNFKEVKFVQKERTVTS